MNCSRTRQPRSRTQGTRSSQPASWIRAGAAASTLAVACLLAGTPAAHADSGRFDLTGPPIDVHVARGDQSLPIAEVPNLQEGDKLTIHADLPETQSVKMIMVVSFLRGSTNPPPENWFTRIDTWDKKTRSEGVTITVPQGAEQAVVFLLPETGGAFSTLRSAVRGRPGTFVRASQDLNEAAFEQARIERYVQVIRSVPPSTSAELLDHSHKLAAVLNLKPNDDCFKRPPDQQQSCLAQTGTQLLMDDGHGQSLAATIASGPTADLLSTMSYTPMATQGGAYMYSAYVGTVLDVVRLMSSLHTAHLQYIPAIAFPDDDSLNLRLNTAPSFHKPQSVIVIALPAIQKAVPPPLRLADPHEVTCLLKPSAVLPLEGAPLVYATGFAHDLVLHLDGPAWHGKTDLPLTPDAFEGGLKIADDESGRHPLPVSAPLARDSADNPIGMKAAQANHDAELAVRAAQSHGNQAASVQTASESDGPVHITGVVKGMWGFDKFTGPTVTLQRLPGSGWTLAPHSDLIAGKTNDIALRSSGTACTSNIDLDLPSGRSLPLEWKPAPADSGQERLNTLSLKLPLQKATPGGINLLVHQFGVPEPTRVPVRAYAEAPHPEQLRVHAGDSIVTLTGTGLSDVQSVDVNGAVFVPTAEQNDRDRELRLSSNAHTDSKGKPLFENAGQHGSAQVVLQDGRVLPVEYSVSAARPAVKLLSKSALLKPDGTVPLLLSSNDQIPLDARFSFVLRSEAPNKFPRSERIEIAAPDGSLDTSLSMADSTLVLQDKQTVIAFLNPAAAFGNSAFGPLQFRPVAADGSTGDWQPLGTLVRTPVVRAIACTHSGQRSAAASREIPITPEPNGATPIKPAGAACTLEGTNLYLIESVSANSDFSQPLDVPIGYAGDTLPIPRPQDNHTLYLKLRDDPDEVASITSTAFIPPHRSAPVPAPAPTTTTPAAASTSTAPASTGPDAAPADAPAGTDAATATTSKTSTSTAKPSAGTDSVTPAAQPAAPAATHSPKP